MQLLIKGEPPPFFHLLASSTNVNDVGKSQVIFPRRAQQQCRLRQLLLRHHLLQPYPRPRSFEMTMSDASSSKIDAETELSLPPSYTTTDPRERSFTLSYAENPRETKTMAGDTVEADDGEGATGGDDTVAQRAEEAARKAEAALEQARRERSEMEKERKAMEIVQRTAQQTVQQFAKAAADTAKPQLDLLANQTEHLSTAMKSMNLLSTQNSLMVTKISKFTGNPRDYKRFMANFEQNIAAKCDGEAMKLNVLIEHCDGPAKSLIEDCIFSTHINTRKLRRS